MVITMAKLRMAHASTHGARKPPGPTYSCEHCEYKATTNGNLKIHTEAVHNGKKYPCDQCDFKATQSGSLKIHQKIQHKIRKNIVSIDRTQ